MKTLNKKETIKLIKKISSLIGYKLNFEDINIVVNEDEKTIYFNGVNNENI